MINWDDKNSKISKYFTVHEATYLPSWGIYHTPSEDEKLNIVEMAGKMDQVRDFIGESIKVHCWIRPTTVNSPQNEKNGKDYNGFVGGAPKSAHIVGKAVDWSVVGKKTTEQCDNIRKLLEPKLEEFQIRMEDHSGPWVHNDIYPPNNNKRYFPV